MEHINKDIIEVIAEYVLSDDLRNFKFAFPSIDIKNIYLKEKEKENNIIKNEILKNRVSSFFDIIYNIFKSDLGYKSYKIIKINEIFSHKYIAYISINLSYHIVLKIIKLLSLANLKNNMVIFDFSISNNNMMLNVNIQNFNELISIIKRNI